MSRMKIKDFKKLEFYQLPKWLFKVKGLKPVDIVIYTLAFNNWKLSIKNNLVNENDEIYFFMTHETIKEELDLGKDQVIDSIKRLVESRVIIQEKFKGKATRFYLEDDLNQIEFRDSNFIKSSRKKSTTGKPTTVVGKTDYTTTENPTTNQSENTDINKTIILNKTEYKKDINKMIDKEHLKEESIDQEKVKFRENLEKYISKVQEITGKSEEEISRIINPVLMRNLDIGLILQKISDSKFLSGKLEIKPKINNFCAKSMLDKILIGFYDDYIEKQNNNEIKISPNKETQEIFDILGI